MRREIISTAMPVIEILEQIGVDYHVVGSLASTAYGIPRATVDADLVADLRQEHVRPLVERLQESYYIDEEMIRDAIAQKTSFNVIHYETSLKVDIFVLQTTPYAREAFRRRILKRLEEGPNAREFSIASPEDTLLNKLLWYKMGGGISDRQWGDVMGVLKVQAEALDYAYMRQWAKKLEVSDLLERAIEEAGVNGHP